MPIAFPATLWSTANTSNGTTSNVVTTRALEQWVIAANATTSNGSLSSVATVNGNYTLTGTNVSVATDSAGFQYMQFSGSSTSYLTANRTMKDVGIDITSGAEWHAVVSYPDAAPHYVFRLLEVGGEGRAHLRVYRGGTKDYTAWPEAGQSGGVSSNYTALIGDKVILSAWRNAATGEIGIGVNGQTWTSTIATATSLARNLFSFWDYNFGGKRCRVYESLGYIDNLTTTERTATINALKAKYNDPNYANVSLLLHFDGANGSTAFTDSSPNALAVTASNVTISTTGTMSGFGQVAYFDGGANTSLTIPASSAFNFGTSNFTIEMWFNIPVGASGSPYGKTFISNENNNWSAGAFSLYGIASSSVFRPSFWVNEYSSSTPLLIPSSGDYRDGNWHFLSIVRNANNFSMYIDGTQVATGTHSGNCGSSSRNVIIGDNLANNGGDRNLLGKLDEIRITNGVARTTTVPTAPFPNS